MAGGVLIAYLNRQVLVASLGFAVVLLLLSLLSLLAQYLQAAAAGEVLPALIPALIALSLPHNLSLIWPLSFFAAVVLVLGRMSAARELDVLGACGMSNVDLLRLLSPVLIMATLLMALLSLYLVPVAMLQFERLHNEREGRDLLQQLVADKPLRLSNTTMLFSAAKPAATEFERVLVISQNPDTSWQIVLAPNGERYWQQQTQYLQLNSANFYQLSSDQLLQRHHSQQAFWAIPNQLRSFKLNRPEAIATSSLWQSELREDRAQLQWRLSSIASVVVLFLLATRLGKLPPRRGRFSALPKALSIYLLYFLAQYLCYQALVNGSLSLWSAALAWPHLAALLLYAALLKRQA